MSLPTKVGPIPTSLLNSLGTKTVEKLHDSSEEFRNVVQPTELARTLTLPKLRESVFAWDVEIDQDQRRWERRQEKAFRHTEMYGSPQFGRNMIMENFQDLDISKQEEKTLRNFLSQRLNELSEQEMFRYASEFINQGMGTGKNVETFASSVPSSSEEKSPSFTVPSSLSGVSLSTLFSSGKSKGSSESNSPKLISGPKKPLSSR